MTFCVMPQRGHLTRHMPSGVPAGNKEQMTSPTHASAATMPSAVQLMGRILVCWDLEGNALATVDIFATERWQTNHDYS